MKVSYHASKQQGAASHNDRTFDLNLATHIDQSRLHLNHYWTWAPGMDFESAERLFYRQNYTQMAEEQNRNRKTKRIPEEYLNLKRYKPEEAIVQIGNVEDQPEDPKIFDECFEAFIRFLNDWNKEHGEHMHLLDYAIHKDEATTHAHIRLVWDYETKDGIKKISRNTALRLAGIGLADPNRPPSRTNTRKMAFDRMCREQWADICEERGIQVDRTVVGGKHKRIQDYKKDIRLQEIEVMRKDTRHIAEIINRSMEAVPDGKKEPGQDGSVYVRLTQEELQTLVRDAKNCERARKAIKKLREEIGTSKANIREYERETLDLTRQRKDMETANTGLVASILETGYRESVEGIMKDGQRILAEQPELYEQIMEAYGEQTGQNTAHPMETEEPELG